MEGFASWSLKGWPRMRQRARTISKSSFLRSIYQRVSWVERKNRIRYRCSGKLDFDQGSSPSVHWPTRARLPIRAKSKLNFSCFRNTANLRASYIDHLEDVFSFWKRYMQWCKGQMSYFDSPNKYYSEDSTAGRPALAFHSRKWPTSWKTFRVTRTDKPPVFCGRGVVYVKNKPIVERNPASGNAKRSILSLIRKRA